MMNESPTCNECLKPATHIHTMPDGMRSLLKCESHAGACCRPLNPKCGATYDDHRCTLSEGHDGWHQEWRPGARLFDIATWQPDREPEAAKTKTYRCEWCDAIHYNAHAGHVCPCRVVPDPEPVPQWRALVDEVARQVRGCSDPLGYALLQLSDLSTTQRYTKRAVENLARIVAVCEQQVGDGWQAKPSDRPTSEAWHLVHALGWAAPNKGGPRQQDWEELAMRAAAWLRDLTDGAA